MGTNWNISSVERRDIGPHPAHWNSDPTGWCVTNPRSNLMLMHERWKRVQVQVLCKSTGAVRICRIEKNLSMRWEGGPFLLLQLLSDLAVLQPPTSDMVIRPDVDDICVPRNGRRGGPKLTPTSLAHWPHVLESPWDFQPGQLEQAWSELMMGVRSVWASSFRDCRRAWKTEPACEWRVARRTAAHPSLSSLLWVTQRVLKPHWRPCCKVKSPVFAWLR